MVWELISTEHAESVFRTPVFGGWLVKIVNEVMSNMQIDHIPFHERSGYEWRTTLTFMPDKDHNWNPAIDYKKRSEERDSLITDYLNDANNG